MLLYAESRLFGLLFNNYTGMIQLRQDMYLALLLDGERTRVYDDKNGKLP